jgi:hypothetical protein
MEMGEKAPDARSRATDQSRVTHCSIDLCTKPVWIKFGRRRACSRAGTQRRTSCDRRQTRFDKSARRSLWRMSIELSTTFRSQKIICVQFGRRRTGPGGAEPASTKVEPGSTGSRDGVFDACLSTCVQLLSFGKFVCVKFGRHCTGRRRRTASNSFDRRRISFDKTSNPDRQGLGLMAGSGTAPSTQGFNSTSVAWIGSETRPGTARHPGPAAPDCRLNLKERPRQF